jgi:hypothetical protein
MPDNPNANQQMHNTSLLQQNGRFNTSQEYVGPNEFTVASAAANGDKIDDDDRMNGQVKHHFSDEYSHSTQAQDGDEGGYQNQYLFALK